MEDLNFYQIDLTTELNHTAGIFQLVDVSPLSDTDIHKHLRHFYNFVYMKIP